MATTLPWSARNPSSRGGRRRRRRQTHKEGGEREPRGRAGGEGAEAWIGPGRSRVGIDNLRLAELQSFSMRAGIGRTVRPSEEMADELVERGGVAARTSFVTARTELRVQKGGVRVGQTMT